MNYRLFQLESVQNIELEVYLLSCPSVGMWERAPKAKTIFRSLDMMALVLSAVERVEPLWCNHFNRWSFKAWRKMTVWSWSQHSRNRPISHRSKFYHRGRNWVRRLKRWVLNSLISLESYKARASGSFDKKISQLIIKLQSM